MQARIVTANLHNPLNTQEKYTYGTPGARKVSVIRQIFRIRERTKTMRRSVMLFTLLAGFSALALAESWQGRLVDPTSSTTMFALVASDKAYKLDGAGNSKAATALKSRADRSSDPATPASAQVMAKITGTKDGQNLKVDTIDLQ